MPELEGTVETKRKGKSEFLDGVAFREKDYDLEL
jgi:hypothetical protein